jgi:hypothetical protein
MVQWESSVSPITSLETDSARVALIVAAHNAACSCASAGPQAYIRHFTEVYAAIAAAVADAKSQPRPTRLRHG